VLQQRPHSRRCRLPVRIGDAGRWRKHVRKSRAEITAADLVLSRAGGGVELQPP
jgi:hypothetical protein